MGFDQQGNWTGLVIYSIPQRTACHLGAVEGTLDSRTLPMSWRSDCWRSHGEQESGIANCSAKSDGSNGDKWTYVGAKDWNGVNCETDSAKKYGWQDSSSHYTANDKWATQDQQQKHTPHEQVKQVHWAVDEQDPWQEDGKDPWSKKREWDTGSSGWWNNAQPSLPNQQVQDISTKAADGSANDHDQF